MLGAYLAGANVLRGAKWPEEATWQPWKVWFIFILVAAVYVPLFAFYKALDAHYESKDRQRAERDRETAERGHEMIASENALRFLRQRWGATAVRDLAAGTPRQRLAGEGLNRRPGLAPVEPAQTDHRSVFCACGTSSSRAGH